MNLRERFGQAFWGDAALYIGMFRRIGAPEFQSISCVDEEGRLWRNPEEVANRASVWGHGTSRDMLLGTVLGADEEDLRRLAGYLKRNGGRLSPGGDGRTIVTAAAYYQLGRRLGGFWKLGREYSLKMRMLYMLGGLMPNFIVLVEMLTAWKDYQLHLALVSLWLHREAGIIKKGSWLYRLCLLVAEERSGGNHLVAYLRGTAKDLAYLEEDRTHARNRAADPRNVWKDSWDAAAFGQWRAHRQTSLIYADFVEHLYRRLKDERATSSNAR